MKKNVILIFAVMILILVESSCTKEKKLVKENGITVSGKVLTVSNTVPIMSNIVLTAVNSNIKTAIQSTMSDSKGNYTLKIKNPGIYILWFTGVNQTPVSIPFIVSKKNDKITLDCKLSPTVFKKQFDEIKILGTWNNFRWDKADIMTKRSDGKFIYTGTTKEKEIKYQLLGISIDNRSINGTQEDKYRYDGGGDYFSVLKPVNGKFEIIFDPSKLYKGNSFLPSFTFDKEHLNMNKYNDIYSKYQTYKNNYYFAYSEFRKSDKTGKFTYNNSQIVNYLKEKINNSKTVIEKQLAAVLFSGIYDYNNTLEECKKIIKITQGTSSLWIFNPQGFISAIEKIYPENSAKFIEAAVKNNKNNKLQGIFLSIYGERLYQKNDKEKLREVYNQLKKDYSNIQEIQYTLEKINPDQKIQVGNQVPDFEVTSLDNGNFITNKSMLGTYYMIDFWATWCSPCKGELPGIHKVYKKYKSKNFKILSLSFDSKPENVINFRKGKMKMPWLNAFIKGGFRSKIGKQFEVSGIPKPILINPKGEIIATGNDLRGEELSKTLAKFLK